MEPPREKFAIRLATHQDIPTLQKLIDQSVRMLQRADYSSEQLEAALGTAYGVDTQLIADRTYYAVEAVPAASEQVIVACGGWSMRKTLYGATTALTGITRRLTRRRMRRRFGHFLCIPIGRATAWRRSF